MNKKIKDRKRINIVKVIFLSHHYRKIIKHIWQPHIIPFFSPIRYAVCIEDILWAVFLTVLHFEEYCELEYCITLSFEELGQDFSSVQMNFCFVIFDSRRGNGKGRYEEVMWNPGMRWGCGSKISRKVPGEEGRGKRRWTGKNGREDCPIPSGKREMKSWPKDFENSIVNE